MILLRISYINLLFEYKSNNLDILSQFFLALLVLYLFSVNLATLSPAVFTLILATLFLHLLSVVDKIFSYLLNNLWNNNFNKSVNLY